MDLRRLASFGERDAERMERYLRAWRTLKDIDEYAGP